MGWFHRDRSVISPEATSIRPYIDHHGHHSTRDISSALSFAKTNDTSLTSHHGSRRRHRGRSSHRAVGELVAASTASLHFPSDSCCGQSEVEGLRAELERTRLDLNNAQSRVRRQARDASRLRDEVARSSQLRENSLKDLRARNSELQTSLDQQIEDLRDARRNLASARDLALQRSRQLTRADAEVDRLRRAGEDQEFRRDDLIRKLASDKADLEKKWNALDDKWHTLGPVQQALETGLGLQQQLFEHGFLRPRMPYKKSEDADGRGRVVFCKIDGCSYKVPLTIPSHLPRSQDPDCCAICAEDNPDFAILSLDHWKDACKGFEGPWMTDIFSFPFKEELACDHPMDVCKTCIKTQIKSQLDSQGSSAWNKLSCPVCDRKLLHEEIQRFASEEDFARYERFYLLEHLSKEPDFRWCLSGTCTNGQIYENTKYMPNRISCEECSFIMCFKHQVPWHAGITCDEYDYKMVHGEDEEKSEKWKQENTKACPGHGCARPIEKGEGCFHMTCRECRHEFCWECLASWSKVKVSKSMHNDGCYFRTSEVGPMGLRGATVDAALNGW